MQVDKCPVKIKPSRLHLMAIPQKASPPKFQATVQGTEAGPVKYWQPFLEFKVNFVHRP